MSNEQLYHQFKTLLKSHKNEASSMEAYADDGTFYYATTLEETLEKLKERRFSKTIIINKCSECPHVGHSGAFAAVAYKPRCDNAGKPLPYKVGDNGRGGAVAKSKGGIPDWCPLEEN